MLVIYSFIRISDFVSPKQHMMHMIFFLPWGEAPLFQIWGWFASVASQHAEIENLMFSLLYQSLPFNHCNWIPFQYLYTLIFKRLYISSHLMPIMSESCSTSPFNCSHVSYT